MRGKPSSIWPTCPRRACSGWCGLVDAAGRWAPGTDDNAAIDALLAASALLPDETGAREKFLIDCWACLLAHDGALDGRTWADSDALSGVFGAMTSRLGGLDMPLETETLGEWWAEYLALAHRSFAADSPCPDDTDDALAWTLAQMSRTSPTATSIYLRLTDGTTTKTEAAATIDAVAPWEDAELRILAQAAAARAAELDALGLFALDAVWTIDLQDGGFVLAMTAADGTMLVLSSGDAVAGDPAADDAAGAGASDTIDAAAAADDAAWIVTDDDLVTPDGVSA